MEERELQADNRFPVWIIEYVWAHKMMDIQEGWFEFILIRAITRDNSSTLHYIALQQ